VQALGSTTCSHAQQRYPTHPLPRTTTSSLGLFAPRPSTAKTEILGGFFPISTRLLGFDVRLRFPVLGACGACSCAWLWWVVLRVAEAPEWFLSVPYISLSLLLCFLGLGCSSPF
jgi:hypothetical protein